jgi:hypothetical protein
LSQQTPLRSNEQTASCYGEQVVWQSCKTVGRRLHLLEAETIRLSRRWLDATPSRTSDLLCQSIASDITQYLAIDEKQQEADAQIQTLRDCFTANIDGWVSSELYEQAKARAEDVR